MNGTYGTIKPATINPSEAEVFYFYRPSRSSDAADFAAFKKLDENCLTNSQYEDGENTLTLPGMYNLKLPMDKFGKKGVYTIYIKPTEVNAKIVGYGSLVSFPDVNGVVFDVNELSGYTATNELVGYRIEFADGSYKIITSSNLCEAVRQNSNNASENGVRYALNSNGGLLFCTLTPSDTMSFTTSSNDGNNYNGQTIILVNTNFNPVMIEVEMVEHDADTISTMLEGDQLRNLDEGMITTFNKDGGIYHQAMYGNVVKPGEGKHYDFKITKNDTVVYSEEEEFNDIKSEVNE